MKSANAIRKGGLRDSTWKVGEQAGNKEDRDMELS